MSSSVSGDKLLIMQEDVKRALARPLNQRQWAMVIDLKKCAGCHACTIACIAENVLPPHVIYRPVLEQESGVFPNVKKQFIPRPCMHCDKPPCVPACPVKATFKQADKVVAVKYDNCIGCGRCVTACPYNARALDDGSFYTEGTPAVQGYEKRPNFEYNLQWKRDSAFAAPKGRARKCSFCMHRVSQGLLPACTVTCVGRATYFGDLTDPNALVSKLLKQRKYMRLLENKGTNPRVYYLL